MAKKKTTRKKKAGRKSKFDGVSLEQVSKLASQGYTDIAMADFFGVATSTWHLWKTKYPEFEKAILDGKEAADAQVEISMYRRAIGYSHPETKVFCNRWGVVKEEVTKHYPPDVAAGKFWLTNRQPQKWAEKQEVEHSGNITLGELLKDIDNGEE